MARKSLEKVVRDKISKCDKRQKGQEMKHLNSSINDCISIGGGKGNSSGSGNLEVGLLFTIFVLLNGNFPVVVQQSKYP